MGWGEKAIEIRSVETGHLDGVFMHKRAQRLKFLSERNDKEFHDELVTVSPLHAHHDGGGGSQIQGEANRLTSTPPPPPKKRVT
ncbi:hypothetical protein CRUP_028791 [Coryphaenoides rupestris]|nr:hypothetical protein CRUP_028791 [Coryphaenoides rupestris]